MNGQGSEAEIDVDRERLVNDDGSVSTELTITIETDGEHVNIPTIVGGRRHTPDEAIALWEAGQNREVGRFASLEDAEAAASDRSRRIGEVLAAGSTDAPGVTAPAPAVPGAPAPAEDETITWARTFGQLAPPPRAAPGGRAPPTPLAEPPSMSWNDRRAQQDYQAGSIERRQRIQSEWYRQWEDWGDKYYKKKGDQREFKDKLYEAVPRERLPDRTLGDSFRDNTNALIEGAVGVGRGWGFVAENLFGMKPEQDPNSFLYMFTAKGAEEARRAVLDVRGSDRAKELAKVKAERMKVVEEEGALASAGAIAQYYKDYPAEIWYSGMGTVPLIAEVVTTGGVGKGLGLLAVGKRVAQGTMSVKTAARVVKTAQAAGVGVPYGASFSAEVYDGVTHALEEIPQERWLTDPIYLDAVKANPDKSHDDIVRFIARDRAFWPSIALGTVAGVTGPLLGIEKALVGPAAATLRNALSKAIGAQAALAKVPAAKAAGAAARVAGAGLGESLQEAAEGVAQAWAENTAVAETAPELAKPSRYGISAAEGFIVGLPPGAIAGAATVRQEMREAALAAPGAAPGAVPGAPPVPGAVPGAPAAPPVGPGAAPAAAAPAPGAAPAPAPAPGAAPAAGLAERIVQASAQAGEAAFQSGFEERLAALPPEATPEQQEAALVGYVDEILTGRPAAPGPPPPPPPGGAPALARPAAAPQAAPIPPRTPQIAPGVPQIAPEGRVEPRAFQLPPELAKIAPRYGYKDRNFEVTFANDFDRATYTLAQQPKNKRHDEILAWLADTGLTDQQLVDHGKRVRARLKEWAQGAPAESTRLRIPAVSPPVRLVPAARQAQEDRIAAVRAERAQAASERAKKRQKVDPARDSLFTAIAKLGGMNRAAVAAEWGVDPKDPLPSRVFGLPVLRADGGMSIDGMAEALVGWGYLAERDLVEFERRFDLERRGEQQYTPAGDEFQARRTAGDRAADDAEEQVSRPIAETYELTPEELEASGYFDLNSDEQRATEAIVAALRERFTGAEAEDAIDRIIERAAIAAEADPSPAAFREAIIAQLREEVGRGRPAEEPPPGEREAVGRGGEEAVEAPRAAPPGQAAVPAVRATTGLPREVAEERGVPLGAQPPARVEAREPEPTPAPTEEQEAAVRASVFESQVVEGRRRRDELVTEARAQGGVLLGRAERPAGQPALRYLLTPSLTAEGESRVTTFVDEEPVGHREYTTLEEAVNEFMPSYIMLEELPEGVLPTEEQRAAMQAARADVQATLAGQSEDAQIQELSNAIAQTTEGLRGEAAEAGREAPGRPGAEAAAAPGREAPEREAGERPFELAEPEGPARRRRPRGVKRPARKPGDETPQGPDRTGAVIGPPLSREWVRESLPREDDPAEIAKLRDTLRAAMDNLEAVRAQNAKDIAAAADPQAAGMAALKRADDARARVEQAVAAVQDATTVARARRVEPGDNAYVKQLQQKLENSLGVAETALEEFRSFSQLAAASAERTDAEVAMLQQAKVALLKDRTEARRASRVWAGYVDAARASRKRVKKPTSDVAFKQAIGSIFGVKPEEFEQRLPRVFIVSENEIHDGDKLTLRRGGKTIEVTGLTPDESAFYHWDANVIVFFKERIEQGEERPAFLHEVIHKRGEQFLGKEQIDRFRREFESWKNAPRGSPERLIYGAVQQRLEVATAVDVGKPLVAAARRAEEILPYIVSEAAQRGFEANPKDILRPGLRGLLARVWQALRRALGRTLGLSNEDAANAKLTVADVMTMAWGAAHLELDAPALEAIASGKPLPRGTRLPGIAAARKALEARPIFGARVAELLAGKNVYVPEAIPAEERRFVTRFTETPTGKATLAKLKKQELAEVAAGVAQAPALGPDNPQFSSIIFKQPRKAVAIRTRENLQEFAQNGRRPDVPFLPVLKEWLVENITDNQRPFLRWLRENNLGRAAWEKLKLVTGRVRERAELYNREILNPLSRDVAKFAKDAGVDNEQAALVVGWWATLRHVPEANAALQMKLVRRIAAGDRTAVNELRRFMETQAGLHPNLGDPDRGAMAAGVTDAEAARYTQQLVAPYSAQQQREIERLADNIVASFARLKRDAIASGQISPTAAAQFPNFRYYVALTGDNAPVWDADQASDAFGSYVAENRLRSREGRAGDTVSESAIEALAERMGRVASYYGSVPFKQELNNIYTRAGAQNNTIGLERLPANAVQQPRHSDVVWTAPNGTRYIFRFSQSSSIGEAILGQNRVETDGIIMKGMDWVTRRFSRAVTQWVPLFGPINMLRDVDEKAKLIRSRGVADQNGNPVNVNSLFKTTWKYAKSAEVWRTAYALAFSPTKKASNATALGRWSNELVEDGGVSTWGENTRRGLETIRDGIKREAALAGLGGVREQWWEQAKEFVARYNLMFEIVSSLSTNAAMRELGVERTKASAETLDLMNFSNVGAKTKWGRAAYAFFNPAVQSGYNLARQLSTRRGQRDFLIVFVLASLVQGLMRTFGDDDPELGNELDQKGTWELDRTAPIKLFGVPLKLPVGFGMSQLAWSLSNTIGRLFSGRYTAGDAASQAAVALLKTFNPVPISEVPPARQPVNFLVKTFTPTAARPIVDMATDTDAWGSKLTTYYPDKSKLRAEQGKVGTPQTYKDISRSLAAWGIDIYPEHVRSIKEMTALGPVGYAIDSYVDSNKEQEGRRLNPLDRIPGSSLLRITGASRLIGGTSRYLEARYYEKMDAVLQDKRLYNQAKSLGRGPQWERENIDRMRRLRQIEAHEATMRELSKEFNATVRELQTDAIRFGAARTKFERISNQREKAMRDLLRRTQDPNWNVDAVRGVTP